MSRPISSPSPTFISTCEFPIGKILAYAHTESLPAAVRCKRQKLCFYFFKDPNHDNKTYNKHKAIIVMVNHPPLHVVHIVQYS